MTNNNNNNNDDTTTTSLSSSSYSYYQHHHQHQQNNSDHDQSSVKMMMNRRNKNNNMSLSSPSLEKINSNRIMLEEDNNNNTNCNNNINNNKIGRFTRKNKHSNNNNNVNNNHNGNSNSNSWQWLSMFLLLYSLSLQLGVFDRTKTSINGYGYGGNNNDSTSPSRSSGNTRGQQQQQHHHHDHRGLEIDDERVPSSSSFASSDSTNALLFESLEASHEHHLARRIAPSEHQNMEGRSNRNSNRKSDSNHRQMGTAPSSSSSSSSSSEQQQQQQQGQTSRRHQEGIEDYEKWKDDITKMASKNTNNNENGSTTQQNTQQYTTQSKSILSTSMEGRLRATLLTNYDRNSYPWEWAWEQHYNEAIYDRVGDKKDVTNNNGTTTAEEYSNMDIHNNDTNETDTEGMSQPQKRTGLPVEFGLNFHKVHALNVAESTADLVVWVRMKWTDPRLRWDPTEFGGLTTTWFFLTDGIGGGEASEIWTPDMYLWNQEEAMSNCLANTYATVSSDGSIFWSRPGRIKAVCKYEGLESFPFDKLGCKIEFGSWSHSGLYFRPIKLDGTGYTVGGSETAGGSYVEFNLEEEVEVEEVVYPPYPCCPEEDWPVLIYSLKFGRSSKPYVRSVVVINILLNVAAFACFWIPPHVGERMGLAITCVLAAVAGELVIKGMLPVCDELSWYNKFSIGSTTFALLVVFESAIVIYFFYYTAEDLIPTYVKWLQKKRKKIQDARIQQIQERKSEVYKKEENTMTYPVESSDEGQKQQEGNELKSLSTPYNGVSGKVGMDFQISANDDTNNQLNGITKENKNQQDRILHDNTSFVRFDKSNIGPKSHSDNRRDLFSDSKTYWRSEKSMVQMVDAGNFKNEAEAEMNAYWQVVSGYIDEGARLLIPLLYCVFLGYIFQSRS